jgi:hypothetical protein
MPASLEELPNEARLRLANGESPSGRRVAICDIADLAASVAFLQGTVIYYPASGRQQQYGGDRFPGMPMMTVQAIDVSLKGKAQNSDWQTEGPLCSTVQFEIEYGIPEYSEDTDDASDQPKDELYLTQSVNVSSEILTIKTKTSTGAVVTQTVRMPQIAYHLTFERYARPDWTVFEEAVGKINETEFLGRGVGQVLFDDMRANRKVSLLGPRFWKVDVVFVVRRQDWNETLNPNTLEWETVTARSGTEKPFKYYDLENIWPETL